MISLTKLKRVFDRIHNVVPLERRSKSFAFIFVCACVAIDEFNVSGVLNTAESFQSRFNVSNATFSWVVSAYALTLGAFIVVFGKIGDIIGPHIIYQWALFFAALFCLLSAVVDSNVIAVIIFRALQGVASSALIPNAYSITAHYFEGKALSIALDVMTVAFTASFSFGSVIGGAFSATRIGYLGFFYFTFAFCSVCFLALFFFSVPVVRTEESQKFKLSDLDYPGSVVLVCSLILILYAFTEAAETWNHPKVYVTMIIGAVMLIGFLIFEGLHLSSYKKRLNNLKSEKGEAALDAELNKGGALISGWNKWKYRVDLLLPADVFKITNFPPLLLCVAVCYGQYVVCLTVLIDYFTIIYSNSPLLAATKLLPLGIGMLVVPIFYRDHFVLKHIGFRNVIVLGNFIAFGSSIWLTRFDRKMSHEYWKMQAVPLFLLGAGSSLFFLAYLNAVMSNTPLELQGVVSGIFTTCGQVGLAIATAILTTVTGEISYETIMTEKETDQVCHQLRKGTYFLLAITAVGFGASLLLKNVRNQKEVSKSPERV